MSNKIEDILPKDVINEMEKAKEEYKPNFEEKLNSNQSLENKKQEIIENKDQIEEKTENVKKDMSEIKENIQSNFKSEKQKVVENIKNKNIDGLKENVLNIFDKEIQEKLKSNLPVGLTSKMNTQSMNQLDVKKLDKNQKVILGVLGLAVALKLFKK